MLDTYIYKNTDLVILAGGKGTRIKDLLGKYPKPMLKFNNKHFFQYVLNFLVNIILKELLFYVDLEVIFFFKNIIIKQLI
jgi:NDP-sugar pyrophosphorylase family protein